VAKAFEGVHQDRHALDYAVANEYDVEFDLLSSGVEGFWVEWGFDDEGGWGCSLAWCGEGGVER